MKNTGILLLICLMGLFAATTSCTDDGNGANNDASDGDSGGDGDSDADSDSDSDGDSDSDSDPNLPAIISDANCMNSCTLQWECIGIEDTSVHPMYDCQASCGVSMPLERCVVPLLPNDCQNLMQRMHECQYNISTCEEYESYSEGMALLLDDDETTMATEDHLCSDMQPQYMDLCAQEMDNLLGDNSEVCMEEIDALDQWIQTIEDANDFID